MSYPDVDNNSALDDSLECNTVLNMYWKPFVSVAWFHFIVFQIAMECDKRLSPDPLCPYSDIDFEAWYWRIHAAVLDVFICIWVLILIRLSRADQSASTKKVMETCLQLSKLIQLSV